MKLILCGGGSGEQNYFANKKLDEIIDHAKPLLYVPLAMDENKHPYDECFEWIKEELSEVKLTKIEMVRSFEELAQKRLNDYCALFIGGGNTYKLLKGIKNSGAFEKIKKYLDDDGIIIGSSAGAVIFGRDIDVASAMDPNDVGLNDTKGFDMINGLSIFPHYTNKKPELSEAENKARQQKFTDSIIEFSKKVGGVIAIPEEDAIFLDNGKMEILGNKEFYYFKDGKL